MGITHQVSLKATAQHKFERRDGLELLTEVCLTVMLGWKSWRKISVPLKTEHFKDTLMLCLMLF